MSDKKEGKNVKKSEETKGRTYFVRLFEKYDIRSEEGFSRLIKWTIFILLLVVEVLVLWESLPILAQKGGWIRFFLLFGGAIFLTLSEALKLFGMNKAKWRFVFYVIDAITACAFMFVAGGYGIFVYMLVLTEFYVRTEKKIGATVALVLVATPLLLGSLYFKAYVLREGNVEFVNVLRESFGLLFALVAHFFLVNIGIAFYRQFLKLDRTLRELDESKRELEKAYAVVAEVTALEERQRIAKEIHDTAGHSITTVIMQTEAAKLIIDKNPEEAKNKLVSANLQAKHALEELRDSVHLLSGIAEKKSLKEALQEILNESSDGTGIVIRSQIENVTVFEEKYRFLCNSLKEGISNGMRHGGATAFWFELKSEDDKIYFLLSDNGKGLETETKKPGFGLSTMRSRAQEFGGDMSFSSEEGEGFELNLVLPADKTVEE